MRLPDAAAVASAPLHVLVRDFPEMLAVLRGAGVDVAARGAESLAAVDTLFGGASPAGEALISAMAAAAAWRGTAPPGPCDRAAEHAAAHAAAAARERAAASGD